MTAAAAMLALALAMPSKYAGTAQRVPEIVGAYANITGAAAASGTVTLTSVPSQSVIVVYGFQGATPASPTMTSPNLTFTRRNTYADVTLWTATYSGAGLANEVVTYTPGASSARVAVHALVIAGARLDQAFSNVVQHSVYPAASAYSASLTATGARSLVVAGVFGWGAYGTTLTPSSGTTKWTDNGDVTAYHRYTVIANTVPTTGSVTLAGAWGSAMATDDILLEIEAAAPGPGYGPETRPVLDYGPVTADSNWATTGAASSVTTSGPNRLVLVFVSADGNTAAAPGVTGSTLGAFTLLYTAASAGDFEWTWVYGKFATSAVTGETLTVGSFGANSVQSRTTVLAYANARNLTTLVAGTDYAAGTPSPMSSTANALVTLTTKAGGSVLVMSGVSQNGTGPFTTTGQTLVVAWGNNSAGGGSPSRYFGTFTSGAYLPTSTYTIGIVTSQSSGAQVYAAIEVPPQ